MKFLSLIFVLLLLDSVFATPSTNVFSSVTNDWYNASYSNVYELATERMSRYSNDVVAAYIMLDWNASFGSIQEISNSVIHVIAVSDTITNQVFSAPYGMLRPSYVDYLNELLPTISEKDHERERYKSYLPHRVMASEYMLKLLDKAGLW